MFWYFFSGIGKLQGKSGKAITKKSTKEVDENFEPPAKQPRRQQKKVSPPIQPRAQRPRRCAQVSKPKMEREPSVSVRKIQPRKSGIETSPEAAGEESENEFDVRSTSVKKRRMSSKKEDNETQLTMATDEVFKTKPANGKQKKLLPHDDFVNNYNSKQQHITYKGQKEAAAYKKTSDSSKDSTFDHLLQSIPRQVAVKKRSSPRQLPKKNYEEPMLFDELDDDFEPHDSSRLSKHSRVSKPQNKPQMGRKLNLKLEKSVPAKKVRVKKNSTKSY